MAKISDLLKDKNKTLFSFEILPPVKGQRIETIFENVEPLMEFRPAFIDVTYHREEYVYRKVSGELLERKTTRKRPGTVGICAALMNRFKVITVPHIICGGFTKEETEDALIDLAFLGIDNVLALRGDAIKTEPTFVPEKGGHDYASDLIQQIKDMNAGQYLDDQLQNAHPTDFCIGVAGYPEKHFEAPNMKSDLKYLKLKQDLGADYIVTQMFFDNKKYFEFCDMCKDAGITIPIIPGLKPLTTRRQIQRLPSIFHIDIPTDLADAIEKCQDDKQAKIVGTEWCIEQSKELKAKGVPCLHYYSMGKSEVISKIASSVF